MAAPFLLLTSLMSILSRLFGRPVKAAPTPPATRYSVPAEGLTERLRVLCEVHGGHYWRQVSGDNVVFSYAFPAGDVVSGQGPTTADAVAALEVRVNALSRIPR